MKELAKIYDPKQVEDKIYNNWLEKRYFHAVVDHKKTPFTIVMPPPNITGRLHMGHALDNTLQDVLTRFKRMQGYSALWLPGTDHASIATEAKVVEALKAQGIDKEDLGREKFLERVWEWKEEYGGAIVSQLKKMGSSCDWDRERFTLDEGCSKAVREVFYNLYHKGLIYRGERMVNWCPHCVTSISDAEVEYEEQGGHLWHLRYPLADGSGELVLATTRPETMLGDTAVAVHPEDERYKNLIGKTVILPLVNKEIPIVGDTYVEREFGTGVVKITPAHDPNDFAVGERHNLPIVKIFTDEGVVNENGGKYQGLERYKARKEILKDLEAEGYLVKTQDHTHNVGTCYRCATTIETMVSEQWFVKMKPLADPANKAVREKIVEFIPERFEKIYFSWMDNVKDWCISRQLWWGHRIPVWYCDECGEIIVSKEEHVDSCPKCKNKNLRQDEDTLDTWFSSALWPFSTLGWPEKTPDLDYFYPTTVLVTAYDIIFFWVARMIFSGIEHMGTRPFDDVFIHGIVRAADGKKMSKSLGNGMDPLEVIDQFGADALRFTLASGTSPGNDMRVSDEKFTSSRNFCNKIWNAARFIFMNIDETTKPEIPSELKPEDKWVLSSLNNTTQEVTKHLENYELGLASEKLYEFMWDVVCDWYIELAKLRFQETDGENTKQILLYVFTETLKLLHPFMPFITEEIYLSLPGAEETIMLAEFPVYKEEFAFVKESKDFEKVMEAIKKIRNTRSEMDVPPSKKVPVYIQAKDLDLFKGAGAYFERLAGASKVEVADKFDLGETVQIITADATVFLPMDQLVDREKELARLDNEKSKIQKDIDFLEKKLNNKGFVDKAPEKVVAMEKEKLAVSKSKMEKLLKSIAKLK